MAKSHISVTIWEAEQLAGFAEHCLDTGACMGMDMGLGKTGGHSRYASRIISLVSKLQSVSRTQVADKFLSEKINV